MSGEASATELFESCAYCDASFENEVRYPVTVREADGGDLEIYSFCDSSCQESWEDEN